MSLWGESDNPEMNVFGMSNTLSVNLGDSDDEIQMIGTAASSTKVKRSNKQSSSSSAINVQRLTSSAIWNHFRYDDFSKRSLCTLCNKWFKGKAPGNLTKHLMFSHEVAYKEYRRATDRKRAARGSASRGSASSSPQKQPISQTPSSTSTVLATSPQSQQPSTSANVLVQSIAPLAYSRLIEIGDNIPVCMTPNSQITWQQHTSPARKSTISSSPVLRTASAINRAHTPTKAEPINIVNAITDATFTESAGSPSSSNRASSNTYRGKQQSSTARPDSSGLTSPDRDVANTSGIAIEDELPTDAIAGESFQMVKKEEECDYSTRSHYIGGGLELEVNAASSGSLDLAVDRSQSIGAFKLADGNNVALFMKLAAEFHLNFTFVTSNELPEYCLHAANTNRAVTFCDMGHSVRVTDRAANNTDTSQTWVKGDWQQFWWALRGKCHSLRSHTATGI